MGGGGVDLSAQVANVAASRALRPVYQPIVDLRSGAIVAYEALVRPTEGSGFSNPGELFTAAEIAGRTLELDRACLEVVAAGASKLRPDLLLSVNVSPRTLEAPEFAATGLVSLFRRSGLAPDRIVLELTEREGVEEIDRLRRSIAACRAAGFHIAADDVGAGNAGLRLLSQVKFDIVKIDLSLVQGGAHRETAMAVMTSLQQLAQRWGAGMIAEGIETPEQLELVRALGIGAGQGYLLGRPGDSLDLDAVDLEALLVHDDWIRKLGRPRSAPLAGVGRSA
jgi:EAL domain-containing protein (putative c-di-GMP-specific phosphodiesterase class I)